MARTVVCVGAILFFALSFSVPSVAAQSRLSGTGVFFPYLKGLGLGTSHITWMRIPDTGYGLEFGGAAYTSVRSFSGGTIPEMGSYISGSYVHFLSEGAARPYVAMGIVYQHISQHVTGIETSEGPEIIKTPESRLYPLVRFGGELLFLDRYSVFADVGYPFLLSFGLAWYY